MVLKSIQDTANNKNVPASMTWDALNRATQAYGAPDVDFDSFSERFDSDPVIQSLIDNFDEHGIVIKTHRGSEQAAMPQADTETKPAMAASIKRQAAKLRK